MDDARNLTKNDIFLKARLLSEGVRIQVKEPPARPGYTSIVVLDGCGILSVLRPNPYSRIQAIVEGESVTVSDLGQVLGTATFEERPDWYDVPLANGQLASTAVPGLITDVMPVIQNYLFQDLDSGLMAPGAKRRREAETMLWLASLLGADRRESCHELLEDCG